MKTIFYGPLRYWLVLIAALGLLAWMGMNEFHTRHFNLFLLSLIAIAFGIVLFATVTYRTGESVTREPLDGEDEF